MKNTIDQRLWIAVHLLYPNSSQALDVYYIILNALPKKESDNYAQVAFLKLENFFYKNQTVRSGQPFRVFEAENLNHWNFIYKKSLKQHLLVIIGLTIFKFSVLEVSELLKITEEKTRFLVNQAFKKLTEMAFRTPAVELNFKFRKASDQSVSYFFTNENLVEYSLGILTEKDKKLVEQGLELYPQLQQSQKKYSEVKDELLRIINSESLPVEPHPLDGSTVENSKSELKSRPQTKLKKSMLVTGLFTTAFLGFLLLRPVTLNKFLNGSTKSSIKIQEVTSQPSSATQKLMEETAAINLREMPVENKNNANVNSNKKLAETKPPATEPSIPAQVAVVTLAAKEVAVVEPKPQKVIAKAKQGGLYRGVVQVSDLETVSGLITEKFVALGGKKAGEVELGWRKAPHVAYYHLTLPEGSIDDAKEFLKNFGQLRLEFENHPRVMPAGIKRIILEVKEVE